MEGGRGKGREEKGNEWAMGMEMENEDGWCGRRVAWGVNEVCDSLWMCENLLRVREGDSGGQRPRQSLPVRAAAWMDMIRYSLSQAADE